MTNAPPVANRFRESLLNKEELTVTYELIPGRGAVEDSQADLLEKALEAVRSDLAQAVSVTDNPGGNPAILADAIGDYFLERGSQPLVHFTMKDRNRNQIESQLYALRRKGIENLLVMTGDYPVGDVRHRAKPVFDYDPVHALRLIKRLNAGLSYARGSKTIQVKPTNFFAGVAVSPFKWTEAESYGQYRKLQLKVRAGADFIVSQLGYDARKMQELVTFVREAELNVPVIANIYVLNFGAAKVMHARQVAGCYVTDRLLARLDAERQSADKGKSAFIERAAKMYAIAAGIGYDGVHIGGAYIENPGTLEHIIRRGKELAPRWENLTSELDFAPDGGFYRYEQARRPDPRLPLGNYRLSRRFHRLMFEPGRGLFGLMKNLSRAVEGKKGSQRLHGLEHLGKTLLYDCKDCGDCALLDLAYLCPMSQCPKQQRNGPCGGSCDGWCEVHYGKRRCIYVRAYDRLARYKEADRLQTYEIEPCDWNLYQGSSWVHYYLGQDHSAERAKM
ncbi:MAG: methylenetetrahydrofolate reductase C-terminal domain-containing protein [Gracilibacteraceae bacterium]|jgi:methylenetetrahydrofolate reductase (NADPH)|nr:methylenetetrahydrofolate reductase C-terminal domain-containing protein [Gracilibacteraceae bacterium]